MISYLELGCQHPCLEQLTYDRNRLILSDKLKYKMQISTKRKLKQQVLLELPVQKFMHTSVPLADGRILISEKGCIETFLPQKEFSFHNNLKSTPFFHPNSKFAYPIGPSHSLQILMNGSICEVKQGKSVKLLEGGNYVNRELQALGAGKFLVSSRHEPHIILIEGNRIQPGIGIGHQKPVYGSTLLGTSLVTCSSDKSVHVADIETGNLEHKFIRPAAAYSVVPISQNSCLIGEDSHTISLYDVRMKRYAAQIRSYYPQTYSGLYLNSNTLLLGHLRAIGILDLRRTKEGSSDFQTPHKVWKIQKTYDGQLLINGTNFLMLCSLDN